MKNYYDDIDDGALSRASEVVPKIDLPQPGEESIIVAFNEEPRQVDIPNPGEDMPATMLVARVFQLSPERMEGSIVLPKSLRFNIAKAIRQSGKDHKKTKLTGKTFKIWSIMDNGQKYYQSALFTQETLENKE